MKLKFLLFVLLFSLQFNSFGQGNIELNPEERAYLFHIVKKSPILDNSIGRYFEYTGPDIRFMNKEINYDSIETIIINDPTTLFIRTSEIGKSPKGIIAEAANKMALWELNKVLLASRQGEKDLEKYQNQYNKFNTFLMEKLPSSATKTFDGKTEPNKKIGALINPSLNFQDKAAMVATFNFLSEEEQVLTVEAINYAINQYVDQRAEEIYLALGGIATNFDNQLVAAGDGSDTSGLLNEREKDENGRWNKGLPKAVGLFPYQVRLKPEEKREKTVIEPLMFPDLDFITVGNNKLTQLHFDVWGYNSNKQTTVVIERNGLSYHLFGSDETRFLSPDSTFSSGGTFVAMMNELEHNQIADLQEKLYGKKGYEFQIKDAHEKKDDVEIRIIKNEKEYSDMHNQTITTSPKAPRSVKKAKRKADQSKSGGGSKVPNTITNANAPKKRKGESEIVFLYGQFEFYEKLIKDLEIEKQAAIDLLAKYQLRMGTFRTAIGTRWATYEEKDGFYIFEDSATFDLLTQEFTFPADTLETPFEVRLLAIPSSPLSNDADEVMLHVNLIDSKPGFDARLQLNLTDVFPSNSWELQQNLFSQNDSVAVRQFFEGLLVKKPNFEAVGRGNGVGEWNGVQTVRAEKRIEWQSYLVDKMDSSMIRLRTTQLNIFLNRGILLEVNTFTDPVKTNLAPKNTSIQEQLKKYGLTGNDYLSAMRSAAVIQKMKQELNVLAGTYLTREEAKIVIDRMNKTIDAMRVSVGATSFGWQELLSN